MSAFCLFKPNTFKCRVRSSAGTKKGGMTEEKRQLAETIASILGDPAGLDGYVRFVDEYPKYLGYDGARERQELARKIISENPNLKLDIFCVGDSYWANHNAEASVWVEFKWLSALAASWHPVWGNLAAAATIFRDSGFTDPGEAFSFYSNGFQKLPLEAKKFSDKKILPRIAGDYLSKYPNNPFKMYLLEKEWMVQKSWQQLGQDMALKWLDSGWADQAKAALWCGLGYWTNKPQKALSWCVNPYWNEKLPGDAAEWDATGLTMAVAIKCDSVPYWRLNKSKAKVWLSIAYWEIFVGPEVAAKWCSCGWADKPVEAKNWHGVQFWQNLGAEKALEWSGFKSPHLAHAWCSNPYWKDKAKEALAWSNYGWNSQTAQKWDPIWRGLAAEAYGWAVKGWNAPDEAYKWYSSVFKNIPEDAFGFMSNKVPLDAATDYCGKYPEAPFKNYLFNIKWLSVDHWKTNPQRAMRWQEAGWENVEDAALWDKAKWGELPGLALIWYTFITTGGVHYWRQAGANDAWAWSIFDKDCETAMKWHSNAAWKNKPEIAKETNKRFWSNPEEAGLWFSDKYWQDKLLVAYEWNQLGWKQDLQNAADFNSGGIPAFKYTDYLTFTQGPAGLKRLLPLFPDAPVNWLLTMQNFDIEVVRNWYALGMFKLKDSIYANYGLTPSEALKWEEHNPLAHTPEVLYNPDYYNLALVLAWTRAGWSFSHQDTLDWFVSIWQLFPKEAYEWHGNTAFSPESAWEWYRKANLLPQHASNYAKAGKSPEVVGRIVALQKEYSQCWHIGDSIDAGFVKNCTVADVLFNEEHGGLKYWLNTPLGEQMTFIPHHGNRSGWQ